MRDSAAALALLLLAAPAWADDPIRPDPNLTPGAVLTTDAHKICIKGYAKRQRHTSPAVKRAVYAAYGIKNHRRGQYEIDHDISLELGGADVKENLWPQSYETSPWNAHVKDRLENFMRAEICAGRLDLKRAQEEIRSDWIGAYRKYLGEP